MYSGFPVDILEVHIGGVKEALANLTERGATEPVVKATVALSDSGFVSIKDAHAYAEVKDDSLTGIYRFGYLSKLHFLTVQSR